jgi:hypothetical protein
MGMPRALPAAVRRLLAQQQVEVGSAEPLGAPGCWRVTGQRWWPLDLPGRATPLHVALPVCFEVRRGADGTPQADLPPPNADELAEAAAFVRSLIGHGQVDASGARGTARAASHTIVVDAAGRERLVRRGFSAR